MSDTAGKNPMAPDASTPIVPPVPVRPPQPAGPPHGWVAPPQGFVPPEGFAPPQGYAPPQGFAPPQGYTPPQGYAPRPQGYAAPQSYGPYTPPAPSARPARGSGLGVVAFFLAIAATLVASTIGSIAAFNIGLGTGREIALRPMDIDFDWSVLTPVREWVLLGEVAFWCGTVLGFWAIVQGIVGIVSNRGRGWAIAAIVIAAVGPIAFATGIQMFLTAGFASGASIGG